MSLAIESAKLTRIEEILVTRETSPVENPPPKLTQYKNSVWEGESAPTEYTIAKFIETEQSRTHSDELVSSKASTVSSKPVKDILDINWANPRDWVRNWKVIPLDERLLIKTLFTSPLAKNGNRYGLKRFNLGSHLMQCIGVDMTNIIGNGICAVKSNLINELGYYSDYCANNRAMDPKTCRRAFAKFMKDNNPQKLFESGYVAFHAVVNSGETLKHLDNDIESYKKKLWSFYGKNCKVFRKLKKKKLVSYMIYVHEMSTRNLLSKELNPHTHVMFFFKDPGLGGSELEWMSREIVREFNNISEEGIMSPSTEVVGDSGERAVRVAKKWNSNTKKSVGYYFRVCSTVENYLKEITPENIRELNIATRENWWVVRQLMSGKSQRRFGYTRIR